jgi:UDP-2-acetamido-2,6-beta-L-arabino-hexul-4-ose reductase
VNIFVTGANGFIGKNLIATLARQPDVVVVPFDLGNTPAELEAGLATADWIFHLAGVNRPKDESEFQTGNVGFTAQLCARLLELGRAVPLVLSSSVQAVVASPYGASKLHAEEVVRAYAMQSGAPALIYRLNNVFGKWCRPNYNSVVATFCYNITHDLPVTISDPRRELELVYIDDVVRRFSQHLHGPLSGGISSPVVQPSYKVTLGPLADLIRSFRQMRKTLEVPNFADELTRKLYATFVSYLEPNDYTYVLEQKRDARGSLAEFAKAAPFGQMFVSRTHPGITRGNHYHDTKAEKFLVLEGDAVIRFRSLLGGDVIEFRLTGADFRVVDIPPGYTHSIENVGAGELVTLFWASEILNPSQPDTNALLVLE